MKRVKSLQGLKLKGGVLLLMSAGGLLFSQMALATSAGTILRNSVSVTYEDNAAIPNSYSATDSVDVEVDLVGSVAWGTAPTGQTVGQGDALDPAYTITLTNLGNGSDTYTLTDNTSESCAALVQSLSAQNFSLSASVTLGATVSSGAGVFGGVNTTIPVSHLVPGDFTPVTDTVIINGNPYVVVSATSIGDATVPDQLVVVGDASADVAAAGEQIGERITVTYGGTGTSGTLGSNSDVCQHDHDLDATGQSVNGNTPANDAVSGWATVVEALDVTVTKYVRNSTPGSTKNPVAADITYDGFDYYVSGVTGNPTDTLEYLVVIENTSNADAENVVFEDTLPAFTTYVASSLAVDTDGDETFDQDTATDETEADNEAGGIITQSGQDIDVYPGTGGDENTDAGGTVLDNSQTAVRYSVTID